MKSILLICTAIALLTAPLRAETLAEPFEAPKFTLTDHHNRPLSSTDLQGHPYVVDFIFTTCQGPCPLMTQRMVALAKSVTDPNVRFVSLSVDPQTDTPEVLQKYATERGATDPRILFATGPKGAVFDIAKAMKIGVGINQETGAIFHSDRFILIDPKGQIRGTYHAMDDTDTNVLKQELARVSTVSYQVAGKGGRDISFFPVLNASLNAAAGILICIGLMFIKSSKIKAHAVTMILAVICSAVFLGCYLTYHYLKEGVVSTFPQSPWRPVYLSILISHTILAIVVVPMILTTLFRAYKREWDRHKKIARPTFFIWLYVSVTGVIVYWMLYQLAPKLLTQS